MTGSLRIKNGVYYAVISYKDNYGRFKQKWISTKLKIRGNKKLAQQILEQEMENFKYHKDDIVNAKPENNIIFMDYVKDYLEQKQQIISASTYRGYMNLWKHMCNFFGMDLKLKDVTYNHLLEFNQYLKSKKGVKNVTIKRYKEVLSPALRNAYRDDLIAKNPYEFMSKLKNEKSKREYYDAEELETLFKYTDNSPIGLIVRVAAYYGFRRSEIIGLRWQSIDFKRKTITIENKVINIDKEVISSEVLKTLSSNRTLPLLPEIENRLLKRKEEIEHNKILYGNSYNHKYDEFVFVNDLGNLYLPDYVTSIFGNIIKKNNLKHIRFHDLRHSCASLLVKNKVPMKNIQEWLGHSSYNLTVDINNRHKYKENVENWSKIKVRFA